ncbi:pancreatic triacylglycerol lipase-like [Ornithodoros turicata]|uniref:pancreatic triacylglycerol lipase-like n=1 Tax=Ornithodoros turicata TaxID=34597 RepID=UPI003138E56B
MTRKDYFMNDILLIVVLIVSTDGLVIGKSAKSKCDGELGCLNTGGFYGTVRRLAKVLPWDRQQIKTKFLFYTRENRDKPDQILWNSSAEDIRSVHFDPKAETKLYAHGYMQIDRPPDLAISAVKEAILEAGPYNFIVVDWSKGSILGYLQATANTRVVGDEIAQLITTLQDVFEIKPESVHIIGHSLGSHIAGYAGERLNTLGRITALDPADPFFEGLSANIRIDDTDALFVEGIHSDGRKWLPTINTGLGMMDPIGHIDFYPNGGLFQPGCRTMTFKGARIKHGAFQAARDVFVCSHDRAMFLYADAVAAEKRDGPQRCLHVGYACDSYDEFLEGRCADCGPDGSHCAVFGLGSPRTNGGKPLRLYFKTNEKEPYCLPHYHVVVVLGDMSSTVDGKLQLTLYGEDEVADLDLSKREEQFNSQDELTYMATTGSHIGPIVAGALLLKTKQDTDELSVSSVRVFYMNVLSTSETKEALTVKLCPDEGQLLANQEMNLELCSDNTPTASTGSGTGTVGDAGDAVTIPETTTAPDADATTLRVAEVSQTSTVLSDVTTSTSDETPSVNAVTIPKTTTAPDADPTTLRVAEVSQTSTVLSDVTTSASDETPSVGAVTIPEVTTAPDADPTTLRVAEVSQTSTVLSDVTTSTSDETPSSSSPVRE